MNVRNLTATVFKGYSVQQLEQQYNARAAVPDCEAIFEKWSTCSADFRRQSNCELDVPYVSGERGTLDLFRPRQSDAPVHMFIHGGYWRAMDKSIFSFLAQGLVHRGALVVIVNYALCPAASMGEIVQQIRIACRWIWRNCTNYGGNPNAIHVSGHSAGGHLTAMLMATDWLDFGSDLPANLIKSGVSVSGLFELEPLRYLSLNDDLRLDKKNARLNSPIFLNPQVKAPFSLVVGGKESDEFQRQSYHFFETWGERGASVEYLEMSNHNHFTIIDQMIHPGNPLTELMLGHMALAE